MATSLFPRFQTSGAKLNLNQTILAADTCGLALVSPPGSESNVLNVTETQNIENHHNCSQDETKINSPPPYNNPRLSHLPKPVLSNDDLTPSNCYETPKARTDNPTKAESCISTHNGSTIDLDETCIPPDFMNKHNITPKADITIDCSIPSSPVLTRSNHLRNERKRLVVKFNDTVNDGSPSLLTQPINKSSNFKKLGSKQKKVVSSSLISPR